MVDLLNQLPLKKRKSSPQELNLPSQEVINLLLLEVKVNGEPNKLNPLHLQLPLKMVVQSHRLQADQREEASQTLAKEELKNPLKISQLLTKMEETGVSRPETTVNREGLQPRNE